MSRWPNLRIGPVARLSLGLVALMVSLFLAADLLFGFSPSRAENDHRMKQQLGETVAIQAAVLLETGNALALNKTLQHVKARNTDILSMAVRQTDGALIAQRGDHIRHWRPLESGRSTVDQIRIPVYANGDRWADVEIAFDEDAPGGILEWLALPTVRLVGVMSLAALVLFYLYLRRAMQYLNPASAVPERVRRAFDVLADGVVVLDSEARIVLANRSFRNLHATAGSEPTGKRLSDLDWLQPSLGERLVEDLPWTRVLRDASSVEQEPLSIPQPDGTSIDTIVGCAPISDGYERLRGCIVTFDDVTEVHRKNEQLQQALEQLEQSREKISVQNEELHRLATRDPLTGCWNRRAFVELGGDLVDRAVRQGNELCCIMADIDHFKRYNDLHGHAVGDQVIQEVAKLLGARLRNADVLCRYGGEEFSIVLTGTTLDQAVSIAERMREAISAYAGHAIRSAQVGMITASFGVASLDEATTSLNGLVDRADKALYMSKNSGRDRVTSWTGLSQTQAQQTLRKHGVPADSCDAGV